MEIEFDSDGGRQKFDAALAAALTSAGFRAFAGTYTVTISRGKSQAEQQCARCQRKPDEPVKCGSKVYCLSCTCNECGVELERYEETTCTECVEKYEAQQKESR